MKAESRKQKAERVAAISAFCFLLSALRCSQTRDARIVVEFWGLGREGEVVAEMIPGFERRNPGIRVVMQQIPWIAAHEKLVTARVGDAMPDVAQLGNTWIPEFVALNALQELGDLQVEKNDYFAGVWATNLVDGKLYGVPWYVDTRVLFYRSDLLAAVGYPRGPRTWSEWMDCMERLVRGKKSRFAIMAPTNQHEPIEVLAMTNGSRFLNADGTRGAFRAPAFAQAFAFYAEMFRRGYAPKVSNEQVANLYQQFAQADFAMHITGPWQIGEFSRRLPADMQDKWATAPLPARDASSPAGVSMGGGGRRG